MLKDCRGSRGTGQAHGKVLCWELQDAVNVLGSRTMCVCHVLVLSPSRVHPLAVTAASNHLKEPFWSYVLRSSFKPKKKKKKQNIFWPRISVSWSAVWKQKPTVKRQTCYSTLYIWAWCCTLPIHLPSFLLSPSWELSQGTPCLSKSHVCDHHSLWTCFHHSTVVQCNVINSIRFFSKHGTPLAKTTLNVRLNRLGGYPNIPIIFITPTQLSSWCCLSFTNNQRKYNCLKNTKHNFKLHGRTENTVIWSKAMLLLSTKSNLRLTISWLL